MKNLMLNCTSIIMFFLIAVAQHYTIGVPFKKALFQMLFLTITLGAVLELILVRRLSDWDNIGKIVETVRRKNEQYSLRKLSIGGVNYRFKVVLEVAKTGLIFVPQIPLRWTHRPIEIEWVNIKRITEYKAKSYVIILTSGKQVEFSTRIILPVDIVDSLISRTL